MENSADIYIMQEKFRILLLEDNPEIVKITENELKKSGVGFELTNTTDQAYFIKAITDQKFDIIFSNFWLQKFDGLEALNLVKKYSPETPFVLLTDSIGESKAIECLRSGVSDIIIKGDWDRFRSVIKWIQDMRRIKHEKNNIQNFQERLITVLNANPDYIWIANKDYSIEYLNDAAKKIFCKDLSTPINTLSISNLYPGRYIPLILYEALPKAIETGYWSGELHILTAEHNEIPVRQIIIAHKNTTGEIDFFSGITHDLTQRKKIENELSRRSTKLAEAQRIARLCNWELDLTSKQLTWFSDVEYLFGPEIRTKHVRNLNDFLELIHPQDREKIGKRFDLIFQKRSKSIKSEFRMTLSNGITKIFFLEGQLIESENTPESLLLHGIIQDITEQREFELAIKKERDLLLVLMENIPDAIYFKDASARFVQLNKATAKILGIDDPKDAIGKTDFDFFPAAIAQSMFAQDTEILSKGTLAIDCLFKIKTDSRNTIWLATTKVPLKNPDGKIYGLIGISRDITQRRKADEQRSAQLELTKVLSTVSDENDALRRCLQIICKHFELDIGEYWTVNNTNGTISWLHCYCAPWISESNIRKFRLTETEIDITKFPFNSIESGKPIFKHFDSQDRNSNNCRILANIGLVAGIVMPIILGDKLFGIATFAKKEPDPPDNDALDTLQSISSQIAQYLENVQFAKQLTKINQCFLEFGTDPIKNINQLVSVAAEILGANVAWYERFEGNSVVHVGSYNLPQGVNYPKLKIESISAALELEKSDKDFGNPLTIPILADSISAITDPRILSCNLVLAVLQPVKSSNSVIGCLCLGFTNKNNFSSEDKKILSIVGSAIGVEEDRHKFQKEHDMMEVQLRQSQKLEAIGQLAAGIAHEINTPTQYVGDNTRFLKESFESITKLLNAAKELLDQAKVGAPSEQAIKAFEELWQSSDIEFLLQQIPVSIQESLEGINRITTIVRAMKDFSHPGSKERTPADINKAIQTSVTIARNEWKYVSDVVLDLDPDLPLVPCYLDDFNQVILNLLINAAHAIADVVKQKPGQKGKITIKTSHTNESVEIQVSDTGIGIPDENKPHIFEPFFTTKGVGKGTGQGLSIAYNCIVKKHGGQITFDSQAGKGTTFTIKLPLSISNSTKPKQQSQTIQT